mgnify:CR=1 FL=1
MPTSPHLPRSHPTLACVSGSFRSRCSSRYPLEKTCCPRWAQNMPRETEAVMLARAKRPSRLEVVQPFLVWKGRGGQGAEQMLVWRNRWSREYESGLERQEKLWASGRERGLGRHFESQNYPGIYACMSIVKRFTRMTWPDGGPVQQCTGRARFTCPSFTHTHATFQSSLSLLLPDPASPTAQYSVQLNL